MWSPSAPQGVFITLTIIVVINVGVVRSRSRRGKSPQGPRAGGIKAELQPRSGC